ncbi:copper chaperone PCu(A)C, partial [Rhodobacter calidifons]
MRQLALALAFLAAPAAAHEVTTETLVIDHPYALETPATALSGPGFLTITNTGDAPDRLLAVRAAFARVVLRGSEGQVGPEGIAIAPGQTVTLAPGGMHVLFMGLDGDPFEEGERIPATLVFERAGEIAVEFWVEPRTGAGPHRTPSGGADRGDPATQAAVRAALDRLMGDGAAAGPVALAADAA